MRRPDPAGVVLVDQPDDRQRVVQCGLRRPRPPAGSARDRIHRPEGVVELAEVQRLKLVEDCAVLELGDREVVVAIEHVLPAGMQPEVDPAPIEQGDELTVVGFTLLPPGGDHGDRTVQA